MITFDSITATLSKKALLSANEVAAPLSAFATDFSADAADYLDTVKVPVFTAGDASEFSHAAGYTLDGTGTVVAVPLDKRFSTGFPFGDQAFARLSEQAILKLAEGSARKIGKKMWATIEAAVDDAEAGAVASLTNALKTYADVAALKASATAAGMEGDLVLAATPATYDALCADETIAKIAATLGDDAPFKRGVLPDICGVRIVRAPVAQNYVATSDALAFATRTTPLSEEDNAALIRDEATGLTLVSKVIREKMHASVNVVFEVLFGVAVAKPSQIMTVAAAKSDAADDVPSA